MDDSCTCYVRNLRVDNICIYRRKEDTIMLREYEYVFCVNLQKKLKEEIFGSIFTTVNYNELYIKIEHYDGLVWEQTINNFADRILNGWTSDYAAYEITEQYRKFVISRMMHKYFVQTKKEEFPV